MNSSAPATELDCSDSLDTTPKTETKNIKAKALERRLEDSKTVIVIENYWHLRSWSTTAYVTQPQTSRLPCTRLNSNSTVKTELYKNISPPVTEIHKRKQSSGDIIVTLTIYEKG